MADECDVVFTCLPHKAAMSYIPSFLDVGLRVVDLSADYRISDADQYESIYGVPHVDRTNLEHAVYGLPELFHDAIRDARLIANPGCYPTAAALSIMPLLRHNLVKPTGIIINAASGVTGAGKSPKPNLHFPEVNEGFTAYAAGVHRHQPEIEQTLSRIHRGPVEALFVPHLLPIDQGILQTNYLDPVVSDVDESELF